MLIFGLIKLFTSCVLFDRFDVSWQNGVLIGMWRSLVSRYTGGVEAAGSNPVIPTCRKPFIIKGLRLFLCVFYGVNYLKSDHESDHSFGILFVFCLYVCCSYLFFISHSFLGIIPVLSNFCLRSIQFGISFEM